MVARYSVLLCAVLGVVGCVTAVAVPVAASADVPPANELREVEVRKLIDRYFRSWSAQDMERYGQCFARQAIVQFVDANGTLVSLPLPNFLRSQREAHKKSKHKMTETAEKVDVLFEKNLARVVVYWKLVDGDRTQYGYDHFTLLPVGGGGWRIANLLYYGTGGDVEK